MRQTVFYRAKKYVTNLQVKAYVWSTTHLEKRILTAVELGEGLYLFDDDFSPTKHAFIVLENNVKAAFAIVTFEASYSKNLTVAVVNTVMDKGRNRLVLRSSDLTCDRTLTLYLWNPSLERSELLTATPVSNGLYFVDFNFNHTGTWIRMLFEDGNPQEVISYSVKA